MDVLFPIPYPVLWTVLSIVLLAAVAIAWSASSSSSPIAILSTRKNVKTILFVGPQGSGKTRLFSKMVFNSSSIKTQMSMKENEATIKERYSSGDAAAEEDEKLTQLSIPLHLVDIPSHPRLRTSLLSQFLPAADGVVFFVDGTSKGLSGEGLRAGAEHLHLLLTMYSLLSTPPPPLLILLTNTSSKTPSTPLSTPTKPASTPSTILSRAKTSITRSLSLRITSSSASSASTTIPSTATLDLLGSENEKGGLPSEEGIVWSKGDKALGLDAVENLEWAVEESGAEVEGVWEWCEKL